MHFSKLESIHVSGTNSQVKGNNKLFDFLEQSNQRKNCDSKNYYKISLFRTYILFTICELGYLLHVHKCINNFESLLFLCNNDIFVSDFYYINVSGIIY
jgi:hypothetical protein